MSSKVQDMTSGSPARLIMLFAIPLMLGNIFQQLYTMVDTIVVGQIVGVQALAALGAVEWVMWLVLGVASGMTQGFSILIAQYYGAREIKDLKKALAHSYILTAILAAAVLVVSQAGAYGLLRFLNTPENIIGMSMSYLRVVFCGIPMIAAYNIFASALRAMGNSKTPLTAMILAAIINVILDILFVAQFHMGVAGAAAATVIAQSFSAVYCFLVLRKINIVKLEKSHFSKDTVLDKKLLKLGTPIVFQNVIIAVGGLVVQYVVNGYGFLFVAGFTATNKLYGLLEMAAISYGYAIVTYVGQNLGAKRPDRIKKGVRASAVIAAITSAVISVVMIFWGKTILSLFISGDPKQTQQVLEIAYRYLFIMACFLWILYFLYVYRSALQGLGDTVIPMMSGVAEFVMRVGVALLLPLAMGENGIFYAEITAWTGAAVLLAVNYYRRVKTLFT
ncbi:MAG: MATE family efflux transporter [Blautia sp.]|nr:MATE family efflux transporter [Eubacteriales bacterium]MED9967767.1 MATE family efflux transporter [Blautia sp.]